MSWFCGFAGKKKLNKIRDVETPNDDSGYFTIITDIFASFVHINNNKLD